jgi:HSP20 family protein
MNTFVKFPTAHGWDSVLNDFFAPVNNHAKAFNPAVNITEKTDGYHIQVAAPGYDKTQLKVTAENDLLTIKGEVNSKEAEKDVKNLRKDFEAKAFTKSFNLDGKVNTQNIGAKYEDGILNIWLPKIEPTPKVVQDVTVN